MNIGGLDRYIIIESASTANDSDSNELVETWGTFHTCFAKITRAGGSEKFEQNRDTNVNRKAWKIRYFPGIDTNMRIKYNDGSNDVYYYIINIDEAGREGLILQSEKRT